MVGSVRVKRHLLQPTLLVRTVRSAGGQHFPEPRSPSCRAAAPFSAAPAPSRVSPERGNRRGRCVGRVRTRTAGGSACEGCVRGTPRAGPGPACHAYPRPLCPARSRAADGDRRGHDPWLSGSGAARGLPRPASCPRPRPPHSPGPAGRSPPPHRPGREAAHGARRLLPGARLWLPLSGRQVRAGGRAAGPAPARGPALTWRPGARGSCRRRAAGCARRPGRRAEERDTGHTGTRGSAATSGARARSERSAASPLHLLHPKESAMFRQLHDAHRSGARPAVRAVTSQSQIAV